MKLFALGLIAIALLPLPAMAKPSADPLNAPTCYMITSRGRLINLNYMCPSIASANSTTTNQNNSTLPKVTADDLCGLAAAERMAAKNQFQANEADKILNICQNDRGRIEAFTRMELTLPR